MTRLLGLFYFIFGVLNINAQESGSFDEREFTKYLIQATRAKISGDIYAADSIYKKCLLLNPESGVVNFELSGLYIRKRVPRKPRHSRIRPYRFLRFLLNLLFPLLL